MMEIPPWNMSDIHTGRENTEQNGLSDGQLSRLGIDVPIYEDEDIEILESDPIDDSIHDINNIGDLEVHGTTNLHGNVNAIGDIISTYLHATHITTNEINVNGRDIEADIGILKAEIDILKADIDIYRLDNNELKYMYQILEEKFQILEEKLKEN